MKYAAFDENSIYAIAESAEQAIKQARHDAQAPEAEFDTAIIDDKFAAYIERFGFDGKADSFKIDDNGVICEADITDDQIEALRQEAGEAGDSEMVAICDRALSGEMVALAEVERVISDARART